MLNCTDLECILHHHHYYAHLHHLKHGTHVEDESGKFVWNYPWWSLTWISPWVEGNLRRLVYTIFVKLNNVDFDGKIDKIIGYIYLY